VLRLDESDPTQAWDERMTVLKESAARLAERRFDAVELRGPGTELTIGLLPTATWWSADFMTAEGLRHLPNLPTEEVFTTPDPLRTEGHVTSTKPLVLQDGTIVRGLRVRFVAGQAVEIDADENAEALRSRLAVDEGGLRLGELALVDRKGRIGPLGTVFYDTLLDENASSHIAFGSGFPFLVEDEDASRVNESATHVDFMIGSPELEVDGVTAAGERVPILRGGDWQL
jgi:aminopeptidase